MSVRFLGVSLLKFPSQLQPPSALGDSRLLLVSAQPQQWPVLLTARACVTFSLWASSSQCWKEAWVPLSCGPRTPLRSSLLSLSPVQKNAFSIQVSDQNTWSTSCLLCTFLSLSASYSFSLSPSYLLFLSYSRKDFGQADTTKEGRS